MRSDRIATAPLDGHFNQLLADKMRIIEYDEQVATLHCSADVQHERMRGSRLESHLRPLSTSDSARLVNNQNSAMLPRPPCPSAADAAMISAAQQNLPGRTQSPERVFGALGQAESATTCSAPMRYAIAGVDAACQTPVVVPILRIRAVRVKPS